MKSINMSLLEADFDFFFNIIFLQTSFGNCFEKLLSKSIAQILDCQLK